MWKIRFKTQVTTCSDFPSGAIREDCLGSEQDHPEFTLQEDAQLQEQKAQKEDPSLRGRQIPFMVYDYLRVIGAHDTVLDHAELFSVTLRDDNIQAFDTRWDEVLLSMTKFHPMKSWKVCTN